MIVAIDTNILVYAEGVNDRVRHHAAQDLIDQIGGRRLVIPAQVLAELFNVLVRKYGRPRGYARTAIGDWSAFCHSAPTTDAELAAAAELCVVHGVQIFDAIILAVATSAGADLLLSEDMRDGFAWRGVTVVNPFAATPHPLLAALLR